jgi:hypothetical protein
MARLCGGGHLARDRLADRRYALGFRLYIGIDYTNFVFDKMASEIPH